MTKIASNQDFQGVSRIENLPDPSSAQHAATKAWVEALVAAGLEGLKNKDPVRVRTTTNINLASPGSSLDSVAMSSGDAFIAAGQTAGEDNGIYNWNGAAVPATRRADASTFAELVNAIVAVTDGTDAGKLFRQTVASGTLGVTALVWAAHGTTAGAATTTSAGIVELATDTETNTGTDTQRAITPSNLAQWDGAAKRYSTLFGDGASTQFDITHGFGTTDVVVSVRLVSGNEHVQCDIRSTDGNTVRLNFSGIVASNAMRCVVLA